MRFYGLADGAVLKMPVRRFWMLNGMIDRIRAEEVLAILPAHSASMGGEHVRDLVEKLQQTVGQPMIVERSKPTDTDLEKLRKRFGRMKG